MEYSSRMNEYLETFLSTESLEQQETWGREECCQSSRSLYCSECFRLFIPESYRPEALQTTRLPFDLHIVLHDKRNSATGVHAVVLDDLSPHETQVTLIDIDRDDAIPDYASFNHAYLLFPSQDSIPISSLQGSIQTLVVLDCKWTRSSSREHPSIACLPKVHLSNPPSTSNYWRWHSAGSGMLCTIEAIYVAATEVSKGGTNNYLHLLWLFGLQRGWIEAATMKSGRATPCSPHVKEDQREVRRTRGTSKEAQDKERGKFLRAQVKCEREAGNSIREPRKPRWTSNLP